MIPSPAYCPFTNFLRRESRPAYICAMRITPLHSLAGLSFAFALAADVPAANGMFSEHKAAPAAGNGEVYMRVVDVGNALCVVVKVPGKHYMLYDAGNFNTKQCAAAVREIVGNDKLDLVVLSHSDADHIGEIPAILPTYPPAKLVYTGRAGTSAKLWPKVISAIETVEDNGRAHGQNPVRNLQLEPLPNTLSPQQKPLEIPLGDAKVAFAAGWNDWPYGDEDGAGMSAAERNNVISIVAKFTYAGRSVILTGDTIGREIDDAPDACRYAEKWMVTKGNVKLKSDVLIGEHHGGDNSSSRCFIEAVAPDYVVFSAGHVKSFAHPRAAAANRYLNDPVHPITADHILRTDRGDDQGEKEWDYGREAGCVDKAGDDDIEIFIPEDPAKQIRVQYRSPAKPCAPKP